MMLLSLAMFIGAGQMWDASTTAVDSLLNVDAYSTAVLGADPIGVPNVAELQGGN